MGNAIFYRNKQYPSAVSGGSGGGGSGYTETVLWDTGGTTSRWADPIVATLSDSLRNYDEIRIRANTDGNSEGTMLVIPTSEIPSDYSAYYFENAGYRILYANADSDTQVSLYTSTGVTVTYTEIVGVKYGGGGSGSSEINYSTTEQQIGTWIDGKPLYQRSFDLRETTFSDGSWTNNILGTHGDGIKIRTFEGKFGLAGYGDLFGDYNYFRSTNEYFTACIVTDDDDLSVRPNMYAGVAVKGGIVTIRYTKNTD